MNENAWMRNLFQPLVVATMVGCVALSLVGLARQIVPAWNGTFLVVGCVLASLEAAYSYRLIQAQELPREFRARFRITEILVLLMLVKVGSFIGDGWANVLADVRTWPRAPLNVFDSETMVAVPLVLVSWAASTFTMRDFDQIGDTAAYRRGQAPPSTRLVYRFFWGGEALLILAGLTRIAIADLLNLQRPPVTGLVLNVLLYFLLGLIMLGQIQFAALRRQWQARRTQIASNLAGRWTRYSVIVVALSALVAFLLPTAYTSGLLATMGLAIEWVSWAVWFVISVPIIALTYLISLMVEGEAPDSLDLPESPAQGPQLDIPARGPAPQWFDVLRSVAFWAILGGVTFYVLRAYVRDHPNLLRTLTAFKPIRFLRALWAALRSRLRSVARTVGERLPQGLTLRIGRLRRSGRGPRFPRLRPLSPRERILRYYHDILQRAGHKGFPRHGPETPYEYDESLDPHLPRSHEEMDGLTESFVETRYSLHPVDREQEREARLDWRQVRDALRQIKRGDGEEERE